MKDQYEDIIGHEHHVSRRHPPMSMEARAAQFAPFSALNGHHRALMKTVEEHIARQENPRSATGTVPGLDIDGQL